MRRMILVPLLIIVAAIAILGGIGIYIYNNYMYYSTDDAQVSGNIVAINAPASGQLTMLSVKQGDTVTAGETIASVTPASIVTSSGTRVTPAAIDITSPINGTIVQDSAVQGQDVAPGLALLQVTNLSNLAVTAYVDENTLNAVKVGQNVDVHVDAYGGTTYTGHVQQIVQATAGSFSLLPTEDYASSNFTKVGQRIPVIITLDGNGGNDLVPGMSSEVTIHLH